jgi:hypothetical protein
VTSADGVVTVEAPPSVTDQGIVLSISPLTADAMPAGLKSLADSAIVLAYDLGPDGSTFTEPVTVTFLIDPLLYGLDPPDGALPLLVVLTTDSDGALEIVGGVNVTKQDDIIVVAAELTHFSPAAVVVPGADYLRLQPRVLSLTVGQSERADVELVDEERDIARAPGTAGLWDWTTKGPFVVESVGPAHANIGCEMPTDEVRDAYTVRVPVMTADLQVSGTMRALFDLDIFGAGAPRAATLWLSGDATCTAPPDATTTTAFVNDEPRSTRNTSNPVDAAGQSSPVPINRDDCFDDGGPVDCVPSVDVVGLAWAKADGGPDSLRLAVEFAAAPTDAGTATFNIGVWPRGDGSPQGPQIRVNDGAASCTYPNRDDGPLPGESCEVVGSEIIIVVDISEMTGRIDVSISSFRIAEDGSVVHDAAQISGILQRN